MFIGTGDWFFASERDGLFAAMVNNCSLEANSSRLSSASGRIADRCNLMLKTVLGASTINAGGNDLEALVERI
ncbi:MAG TPA: hypothetical protein PLB97_04360 [Accumulibacter sp.]|nr:hypothetical protein [Accumulibacter sp.]HPP48279.1 hypothetical protein [Accumulibacter sp.]